MPNSELPLPLYAIDLISQYLAQATGLGPHSKPADYVLANRLAFNLAILLPAQLFRVVRDGAAAGDPTDVMQAIIGIRNMLQASGNLDLTDAVYHSPPPLDPLKLN